jgi:O-antigen/teichoic acid export membrane protein
VAGPLERIVRSGLAYQAAAFLSAGLAFATYRAYTTAVGQVTIADADLILAWLIFAAIFARLGFGEALLRHWFTATDQERPQLQRTIQSTVAASTVAFGAAVWVLAPTIAGAMKEGLDANLVRIAGVGLVAYCNLELAQTVLRARDDRRTYLAASLCNVVLTTAVTVVLVVVLDLGVQGYLIGNYAVSGVILAVLWARELPVWRGTVTQQPARVAAHGPDAAAFAGGIAVETVERVEQTRAASRGDRRALLRFGLPTVPADAAIFGFNLLDRTILRVVGGAVMLAPFSHASKIAAGVILVARAFQLAFPPLAYGIEDAQTASRVYADAVRGYAVVLGATVAGVTLCAPWTVHVLVGLKAGEVDVRPEVIEILPLLATAWALWGVVPVMTTIAGRLGATKLTVPASVIALAVNALCLVVLVPHSGARGAATALIVAYVVLIAALNVLTRRWFPVAFDWPRIGAAVGLSAAVCVLAGPLADAPQLGWSPAVVRLMLFAALIAALWIAALRPPERAEVRGIARRLLRRAAP